MQSMLQDSLKSIVYRSFIVCDDPKGVECKMIRRSKIDPPKMGDNRVKQRPQNGSSVSSSKKGERREMVSKESAEELNSIQLAEVVKGAQNLNRVIDSWPEGISFDRQSKDIAKDLLKGALDLQESLVMLRKLQEASQYMAKLKKRSKEKPEGTEDHNKREFSVKRDSRDCYDKLREVIKESFARQNLLPPSYPIKRVSLENGELDLFPDLPSTSSSQSSIEKSCFHRRKMDFQSQELPSFGCSLPKVKEDKPKGPNLIAKLMGLEDISSKPLQSTLQKLLEKDRTFNQRRPVFEIDMPMAKKPPFVTKQVDPKGKTLEEIIETMQFKGLLKGKFVDGSKHETCHHNDKRFDDGSSPIVIMKPRYAPEKLQPERLYTTTPPYYESSCTKETVRRSRREEYSPNATDCQKRVFDTTLREENGQITKFVQEKGETPAISNEIGIRVHGKLSSIKTKASDSKKPRQQNKEVIEKKLDKIQKVAPSLRKTEGMKNVKVKDAAKSRGQDKLRKADTVPQKSSTSNLASKRATIPASHNSRNMKNMKTDKPIENKEVKDVHIDLISKKETDETDNKVEASEKLCFEEAFDVYENPITDDHMSDASLACESTMVTVMCDMDMESREHENSISEGIEHLRSYEDLDGMLTFDTIYSLIKKDLWCKGEVNGGWDLGWKEGFSSDEMDKIVADIEKHLLSGIIEDELADFAV